MAMADQLVVREEGEPVSGKLPVLDEGFFGIGVLLPGSRLFGLIPEAVAGAALQPRGDMWFALKAFEQGQAAIHNFPLLSGEFRGGRGRRGGRGGGGHGFRFPA
jgi:hypothetical protein